MSHIHCFKKKWHDKKNNHTYGKNRCGAVHKNLWNMVTKALAKKNHSSDKIQAWVIFSWHF